MQNNNLPIMALTIKQCSKILNSGKRQYTEEQVKKIRDFFSLLAELQIEAWQHAKKEAPAELPRLPRPLKQAS